MELQFAVDCKYLDSEQARPLYAEYDEILAHLVHLIENSTQWILHK
jgi:hypothetical protein